jgi:DNA replication regulator DPB11
VEKHRLPIFSAVVVCPSGITDITRRTQINKLVTAHDDQYLKSLERPVKVTHLLCSGDEETEKMRDAEKFNSRGEAKIHLVGEEWFWDSPDFGGRFDDTTYQVRRPRPERKTLPEGSWQVPK